MTQLTKREQIAVAVMQALIGTEKGARSFPSVYAESMATASLKYADALLSAFEKNSLTEQEDEDTHGD